jgi:RNA polymerase sigma-B factor
MSVQEIALEEMSAEDLLIEMVRPETTELHRVRLRERLVEMHEWLAIEITRRYRYRGESMDDLKQAAYVGLMKAINGFDADLGHDFRGYAAVTMTGEVKRHFRDRTWAIRVPRVHQERRAELNRLVTDLSQSLGRSPTVAELAAAMKISEEDVLLTMEASAAHNTLSLDAPVGSDDDSSSLGDIIAEQDASLDTLIDSQAVKLLIDTLPARERNILLLRFYGNQTQAEIAAEFGISQMHVSRILRNVLTGLRQALAD